MSFFKRAFIGVEEYVLPDGAVMSRGISTTRLNTAEMTDYQNRIQAWAANGHGVIWDF